MDPTKHRFEHTFRWLNITQFFGALNDNVLKFFIIFCLIELLGKENEGTVLSVIGAVFALPFLLFSAAAGVLADRMSKKRVIVFAKCGELATMILAMIMFSLEYTAGLYLAFFLMATQSAFFGPSKYGIIRELVPPEKLSSANGHIQAFTYISIIVGTVLAPAVSTTVGNNFFLFGLVCVLLSVVGLLTSFKIGNTPPAGGTAKISPLFFMDIFRTLRSIRGDKYVFGTVVALAYFLMIAAFIQLYMIPYGMEVLGYTKEQCAFAFVFVALGIGVGSFVAGRLSNHGIEIGVVPMGAIGLTVFNMSLAFIPGSPVLFKAILFCLGISTGLFIVPLQSYLQSAVDKERLGEVLAANSFVGWVGVLISALMIKVFTDVLAVSPRTGFLIVGLMTLLLTVATVRVLPEFLMRFCMLVVTRFVYRVKVVDREYLPQTGAALLVCNHVALSDVVVLQSATQRRLRFMMYREYYEHSGWRKPLFRLMGVILISYTDPPKMIMRSLQEARKALDEGYIVCIFPEAHLTRTGMLQEFKSGFERILKGSNYPIVPAYLGNIWGSIYSYAQREEERRRPKQFPYPVTLMFGTPMPATATAFEVRTAVSELGGAYYETLKPHRRSLGAEFIRTARKNWNARAMNDTTGKAVSFKEAAVGAVALSRLLEKRLGAEDKIGVLLPSSVGGALTNLAITLMGKVPVNLNYTSSEEAFASAVRQCDLRSVVTSKAFLDKIPEYPLPDEILYVEDLTASLTGAEKFSAFLAARFGSWRKLAHEEGFHADKLATVIFSSGSTAEPKGVMLSHHNILSNVESFSSVILPKPEDNICAALPFFHSFGFTVTLWFPMLNGFSASYHTNPLEGQRIADLVRENKSTMLMATPTFLLAYIRRAKAEDFASLRIVVTGAEKLKDKLAETFYKKFGIQPLEGYGATELSPVAAANVYDVDIDGYQQKGRESGTVGHALPGVTFKIVDPESMDVLPPGEEGLVLAKGPNVMLGYLGNPEKTAEVLNDGWYNTGDIAVMQTDGFLKITDRLSRFSKIGGEMVPHVGVEEQLLAGLNKSDAVLVVTAIPDERKGERLVVVYKQDALSEENLRNVLDDSSLPNLWKPQVYIPVDEIPILGSGKLDLKQIKTIALAHGESS